MQLSLLDRADMVRALTDIRDKADALLGVLLPEAGETVCEHPADAIRDESTMDDDGGSYRCTRCGAVSPVPFPSLLTE